MGRRKEDYELLSARFGKRCFLKVRSKLKSQTKCSR